MSTERILLRHLEHIASVSRVLANHDAAHSFKVVSLHHEENGSFSFVEFEELSQFHEDRYGKKDCCTQKQRNELFQLFFFIAIRKVFIKVTFYPVDDKEKDQSRDHGHQ